MTIRSVSLVSVSFAPLPMAGRGSSQNVTPANAFGSHYVLNSNGGRLIVQDQFHGTLVDMMLLSDAERTEDEVQDVVRGSCAGDFVERTQGAVEVHQQHLVRGLSRDGRRGRIERRDGVLYQLPVAHVGEEAALRLARSVAAGELQDH